MRDTHDNRRKLRLWEEQGDVHARFCPYTGERLSFEMVTSAQTEVDHILPFSRTLDNSMANMVVCVAGSNRVKRDRSPFEAFGNSPAGYDYDAMRARAAKLPGKKRWRFQPDAMERYEDERGFLDRQLNETRYLSRLARAYLACLYEASEGVKVRVLPGFLTALLRRGWGLNGMLGESSGGEARGKQRDDHRHHAIDAFIAANTTQGLLQRFSRAAGLAGGDVLTERLASLAPPPWDGFSRECLKGRLDEIIVSHKPDRGSAGANGGTSGQLHNETAYGLIEPLEDGATQVTHRKPVSEFKKRADLKKVRNDGLKAELMALWDEVHAGGGNAADFAERAKRVGVSRRNGRRRVRSVRVVENLRVVPISDHSGRPYKGYKTDGNEFADIWRMRDGNWKIVVVPTFHANQPDFDIERFRPTTTGGRHRGKPDPVAKRIARIYKNDMCALGEGDERRVVRVRKFTAASICLDDHNEANVDARERKNEIGDARTSAKTLREQGFRPIRVDAIGRVLDPGPFQP